MRSPAGNGLSKFATGTAATRSSSCRATTRSPIRGHLDRAEKEVCVVNIIGPMEWMKWPSWTGVSSHALRRIEHRTTEEKYSVSESVGMKRIRLLRTLVLVLPASCVATARAGRAAANRPPRKLADKAAEVVEVALDERSWKACAKFFPPIIPTRRRSKRSSPV